MKTNKIALAIASLLAMSPAVPLATPILSWDLSSFAILGGETVTNVPTSTVVGNVGVSPGSSITGFNSSPGAPTSDPQVTNGLVHTTTTLAGQAQHDLTVARSDLDL